MAKFSVVVVFLLLSPFIDGLRFLVVGGTGRVGGSAGTYLCKLSKAEGYDPSDVTLILGGRSSSSYEASKARISSKLIALGLGVPSIEFLKVDLEAPIEPLTATIESCSPTILIHTAGPFQQRTDPNLLKSAIALKIPYVDVCDEPSLCSKSKALSSTVPAIVGAGIWPGTSAIMATEAVHHLRKFENSGDISFPCDDETIDLSFYTAGTGNAGATIVSATFLLLCQKALTFSNGKKAEIEPWIGSRSVDFGGDVQTKTVRLLDNPDVFTLQSSLSSPNISSRFATSPELWNLLFGAMKTSIPKFILEDKILMQGLAVFSLPVIRFVDSFVGATNAMRVDVSSKSGNSVTFRVIHDDLEECVGLATASFAYEVLKGMDAGIYYPSDLGEEERKGILERVKKEAVLWDFETSYDK
ncbi:hypothetical protein TrVE_jg3364 [Triparma verrucosa]|uniref:Saccharopine dehydrogenase NADP binding domain-containing protein n=1 Tax=Triparma verrucosa TaxID=1606542 RepID=A0A9W7FP22_9STRA|nr:hypothetical protein TrVE_jg3364 [Triparma verrucosa]